MAQTLQQHFTSPGSKTLPRFISFEGIEGSGKTTQIKRLQSFLEERGHSVHLFREPGGTIFGEKLREAILNSKAQIHPYAEALLFSSARTQLLTEKILPILQAPEAMVLVDRYIDSSISYQGVAGGLGLETILAIHSVPPLNLLPDITFYLKISVETSEQRQALRGRNKDYFEQKGPTFYQKLIQGLELAQQRFPERIVAINAENSLENVTKDILSHFQHLPLRN